MSRRTASSSGTVSLFPFLAVLVCAMGALILLLLVTTRRIRQRTVAEEVLVQPVEAPVPRPAAREPESSAEPPLLVEVNPTLDNQPLLPLLAGDPPPPPPKRFDPTPVLLEELAALEAQQQALADEVERREQELTRRQESTAAQSEQLRQQEQAAEAQAREKQRLSDLYVRLRQHKQETDERAEDLRRQIQHAREQLADSDSRFAVVPYDGHSGTTRRPIIIECTADRLSFVSEGISLSAEDLCGFTPQYNPLLYVTKALIRYWERRGRDSNRDDIGKPYVMLVVRPGGTTGYYVARGLLAGLGEPFGYELVTNDQRFAWPESEREAVAIGETLIDTMISERDELMDVALRSGAQLSDFSNDQGEFRLAEIERLQNPTREVTINGQRYSRAPQTAGGLSGDRYGQHSPAESATGRRSGRETSQRFGAHSAESSGLVGQSQRVGESDGSSPQGVYTQQNSAVTQADRMPERPGEGTPRMTAPQRREERPPISEIDPFSEVAPAVIDAEAPTQNTTAEGGGGVSSDPTASQSPASMERRPPPRRLEFTPQGRPAADDARPQWGARSGSGLIGFEKQVRVEVSATQIRIGDHDVFLCDRSTSTKDLQRLLTGAINRQVRSWESPPKSFYWVPAIHFAVAPDGRAQHERLRTIVRNWDLQSTFEQIASESAGHPTSD